MGGNKKKKPGEESRVERESEREQKSGKGEKIAPKMDMSRIQSVGSSAVFCTTVHNVLVC